MASLTQPSVLKQFLRDAGLEPRRGFSQNFLIDGNIVRQLVATAHLTAGECVLEVGPGPGGVTEQLLAAGGDVVAVEKDLRFATQLTRLPGKLTVHAQDILTFPLDLPPFKVVASLPYHLTSEILDYLIPHPHLRSLTVIVQKETALRLLATPGSKAYNAFTLFLRYYGEVTYIKTVSRRCFYPQPRVDSAIIHFMPRPHPPVEAELFLKTVRTAFTTRRKMLRHAFGEAALIQAEIPVTARPEELSLMDFVRLSLILPSLFKDVPK